MEVKELFKQMQDKLILDTKENEIPCTECKGLRVVFEERDDKGFVVNCKRCYNGKLYKCKFCGTLNNTDFCRCEEARTERDIKFRSRQYENNQERYKKATKIHIKEYDGMLISLNNDERVVDVDEFLEEVEDMKYDDPDFDIKWTFGTKKHKLVDIDINEVIYNKSEDGYEGMIDNLDMKSTKLKAIQELIDEWEEDQGDAIYVYNEDYSTVVLLKE